MSFVVHQPTSPFQQLAVELLAISPGKRGETMQAVVSFRAEPTWKESLDVGRLRALFAKIWELRFSVAVPIRALRRVAEPPVPIKTVIQFSLLSLVVSIDEAVSALVQLIDYLNGLVGQIQRPAQLALFDVDARETSGHGEHQRGGEVGTTVSCLNKLILSGRKFATIYADPPWDYDNSASRGAAGNHYPTMTLDRICAEPVRELVQTDAHLHLWTTNAFMRESFDVMDAWGFKFKSCFVWVKSELGMGNYWRVSHEFLMLGVRGNLTFQDRSISSWLDANRTIHSRKPGIIRALVERVSPGPYLEMYGREELPNSAWSVYGNQIETRLF